VNIRTYLQEYDEFECFGRNFCLSLQGTSWRWYEYISTKRSMVILNCYLYSVRSLLEAIDCLNDSLIDQWMDWSIHYMLTSQPIDPMLKNTQPDHILTHCLRLVLIFSLHLHLVFFFKFHIYTNYKFVRISDLSCRFTRFVHHADKCSKVSKDDIHSPAHPSDHSVTFLKC
jgi:hypothetical protein